MLIRRPYPAPYSPFKNFFLFWYDWRRSHDVGSVARSPHVLERFGERGGFSRHGLPWMNSSARGPVELGRRASTGIAAGARGTCAGERFRPPSSQREGAPTDTAR